MTTESTAPPTTNRGVHWTIGGIDWVSATVRGPNPHEFIHEPTIEGEWVQLHGLNGYTDSYLGAGGLRLLFTPGREDIHLNAPGQWLGMVGSEGQRRLLDFLVSLRARFTRIDLQLTDERPVATPHDVWNALNAGQMVTRVRSWDWRPSLRPESYRRYEDLTRLHIVPELGATLLGRLTAQQVQAAYGRRLASGLSPTTVGLIHGVLHKAIRQAVQWGLVARNVTEMVKPPRRSTPEMRVLSPVQARQLLEAVVGDRHEALYILAVTCGLRLGELQALRWREIDIDARRLRVTATLQAMVNGIPVLGEPKTARGRREIRLPEMVVGPLRQLRAAQLVERLQSGSEWEDYDLVFTNGRGRPVDGNNFRARRFGPLLASVGLPAIRFHDLRHTAATLLMGEGVPIKVASELLGHADVTTTLRTYSHVLPNMQQEAASTMDRLFAAAQ